MELKSTTCVCLFMILPMLKPAILDEGKGTWDLNRAVQLLEPIEDLCLCSLPLSHQASKLAIPRQLPFSRDSGKEKGIFGKKRSRLSYRAQREDPTRVCIISEGVTYLAMHLHTSYLGSIV